MARSSCEPRACSRALHLRERPVCEREPPLKVLGGAGERGDRVLPPALRLDPDLVLGAGQTVERLSSIRSTAAGSATAAEGRRAAASA